MSGRANILLVDDRRENLLAFEAVLEPLGHHLVSVTSGQEALKELLQQDFACILLDVQMPELDGFETAELIKQRERTSHIPIIFLTAISKEESHVFRGYSAGAVDYLFKPFEPEVLRSKVAVFIELWEKTEQLRLQSELLREQALVALRRESEERYRQLADAMPQIVWTSAPDGGATYFNRRWFDYTGMSERDAGPHAWHMVTHPDDLPRVVARRERGDLRGRVPLPERGRRLPLAPRARCADPRRERRDRLLGRHGHGHPRPQARRGAAELHHRGGGHPVELARLPRDARPRRPGGGAPDGRLVRGRDRGVRRLDPPDRERARGPGEGALRPRAAGAVSARSERTAGRTRGHPDRRAGARPGDPEEAARRGRGGRDPSRPDPGARLPLLDVRAVDLTRPGARRAHVRRSGVGPHLRR